MTSLTALPPARVCGLLSERELAGPAANPTAATPTTSIVGFDQDIGSSSSV